MIGWWYTIYTFRGRIRRTGIVWFPRTDCRRQTLCHEVCGATIGRPPESFCSASVESRLRPTWRFSLKLPLVSILQLCPSIVLNKNVLPEIQVIVICMYFYVLPIIGHRRVPLRVITIHPPHTPVWCFMFSINKFSLFTLMVYTSKVVRKREYF